MLQPAHFTVQTVDAGLGEVLVYIEDPEGHTEEVWRGHREKGTSVTLEPESTGQRQEWPGGGCQSHPLCWRGAAPPWGPPGTRGPGGATATVTSNLLPSQ